MDEEERAKIKSIDLPKYRRLLIANGDFLQYDDDGCKIQSSITGRNIRSAIQVDREWCYTISDKRKAWDNVKKKPEANQMMPAGLFIYDYQRLVNTGDIEVY